MIFVFLFLTSLCIIGSSLIQLIRTDSNVFLFLLLNNIPLCICITTSLSIHLSVEIYCMMQVAQIQCSVTMPRGMEWGDGRSKMEGTHVYLWLSHVSIWQKPIQYCKVITFQLKINMYF